MSARMNTVDILVGLRERNLCVSFSQSASRKCFKLLSCSAEFSVQEAAGKMFQSTCRDCDKICSRKKETQNGVAVLKLITERSCAALCARFTSQRVACTSNEKSLLVPLSEFSTHGNRCSPSEICGGFWDGVIVQLGCHPSFRLSAKFKNSVVVLVPTLVLLLGTELKLIISS